MSVVIPQAVVARRNLALKMLHFEEVTFQRDNILSSFFLLVITGREDIDSLEINSTSSHVEKKAWLTGKFAIRHGVRVLMCAMT